MDDPDQEYEQGWRRRHFAYSPENVDVLRRRLALARDFNSVTIKELVIDLKLSASESKMSRFLGGSGSLSESDYNSLRDYLMDKGLWQKAFSDKDIRATKNSLFYAMCSFYEVENEAIEDMRKRALGVYRLYRPSILMPGYFVVGAMRIHDDKGSGALIVRAKHRYIEETTDFYKEPERSHTAQRLAPDRHDERFFGYLLRRTHIYFMELTDERSDNVQSIVCPISVRSGDALLSMQGIETGFYSGQLYVAPIFIERVEVPKEEIAEHQEKIDDEYYEKLSEECNIYENIPRRVSVTLQQTMLGLRGLEMIGGGIKGFGQPSGG